MLQERQVQILIELMNRKDWVFGKNIADVLHLSTRTIRKEIALINAILNQEVIISSVTQGYRIDANHIQLVIQVVNDCGLKISEIYQREIKIISTIGCAPSVYLEEFENQLGLAQTATRKVLKRTASMIQKKYGKTLFQVEANTYALHLNEIEYRELLFRISRDEMITNHSNSHELVNQMNLLVDHPVDFNVVVSQILKLCEVNQIDIQIDDLAVLSVCVCICCIRNQMGYKLADSIFQMDDIYARLLQAIVLEVDDLHHEDSKVLYPLLSTFKMNHTSALHINNFTKVIFDEFCEDVLLKYALDLRMYHSSSHNLLLHIEYMIRRIENNYELSNPITNDIKKKYPFAYEISMLIVQIIFKYYRKYVADSEISYLAIYMEYFLKHEEYRIKVVLVDSQRHSVNRIVKEWIQEHFINSIVLVKMIDRSMLANLDAHEIDLVLSIQEYVFLPNIMTYRFDGLPTIEDMHHINKLIHTCKMNRRILHVLDKYLIEEHTLFFTQKMQMEEVIQHLASVLKAGDCIEDCQAFVDDVLQREVNYPTNISNILMLPHPLFTFAKKTSVAVAVLEQPIAYLGSMIQLVFLLAIEKERNMEMNVLFQFFNQITENPNYSIQLASSHTFEEFQACFNDFRAIHK